MIGRRRRAVGLRGASTEIQGLFNLSQSSQKHKEKIQQFSTTCQGAANPQGGAFFLCSNANGRERDRLAHLWCVPPRCAVNRERVGRLGPYGVPALRVARFR